MTLKPGQHVGSYEILSLIGAGGMGEVYRAHDGRLHRDVAIKVLPDLFAADADRLMRFEREAQALAALNHPHIAAIYGLEEQSGVRALVMELVEGDTLAGRLTATALPWRKAVGVAIQIAEALEAAHEKAIVHRDLKPANIKITPDGSVKVLDFGLAKTLEPVGTSPDLTQSPTMSVGATQAGTLLGTAAYMSPEQMRGVAADARADIWAFGCVLFEMLTGRPAFDGATASDVIAGVLRAEPLWNALPGDVPPALARVLRRCLTKERKLRYQAIGDVRADLDEILGGPPVEPQTVSRGGSRRTMAFGIAGVALGAAIASGLFLMRLQASPTSPVIRFAIHDTDKVIVSRAEGDVALSPDGETLAFVGFDQAGPRIWLRALDALDARPLPGTEGAGSLCWSPDSRSLAFVVSGRIKRIAIVGGAPEVVVNARVGPQRSIAYGRDGTILYLSGGAVWRVGAGPAPVNVRAPSAGETPESLAFLPDGRHYLVSVRSDDPAKAGTFVAALGEERIGRLLPFPTPARYAGGRLLFVRDRVLYAQPMNLSTWQLTGDPVPVTENLAATFSVSDTGGLVYVPVSQAGQSASDQLLWMNREGQVVGRIEQATGGQRPTLSPDARYLAMSLRTDMWVMDLARGVLSRVTSGARNVGSSAVWSADSQRLSFVRIAFRGGKDVIFELPLGGAGKETVVREPDKDGEHAHPTDVSASGEYMVYEGGDGEDIWFVRLTGDRQARPYLQTPNLETQGVLSPDARWLAYTSDASTRFEVYVQRFPEPGGRIQVSPNGGSSPHWRRDGKELFYLAPDGKLMAVPVRTSQPIEFASPIPLFQFFTSQGNPSQRPPYDVAPDGQRFIVSAMVRRNDPSLQVLLNWPALVAAGAR